MCIRTCSALCLIVLDGNYSPSNSTHLFFSGSLSINSYIVLTCKVVCVMLMISQHSVNMRPNICSIKTDKINAKCLANIGCSAEAVDNVQYLHVHHDHHHQTVFQMV